MPGQFSKIVAMLVVLSCLCACTSDKTQAIVDAQGQTLAGGVASLGSR